MSYSFGPMRHPDYERLRTPVGTICLYCRELIGPDDSGFVFRSAGFPEALCTDPLPGGDGSYIVEHRECHLRSLIGSVAHVLKQCSCYMPGADETDPPELTKRQAARLAVELWEQQERTTDGGGSTERDSGF
jgi:hypothetical protein